MVLSFQMRAVRLGEIVSAQANNRETPCCLPTCSPGETVRRSPLIAVTATGFMKHSSPFPWETQGSPELSLLSKAWSQGSD